MLNRFGERPVSEDRNGSRMPGVPPSSQTGTLLPELNVGFKHAKWGLFLLLSDSIITIR